MVTQPTRFLTLLLVAAACAPAAAPFTDEDREAVAREVTAVLAELTEAMNNHDGEKVVAFYADNPDFLYLGCTQFITGGATFKRMVAPYYSGDVSFEQRVVSVQVLSPTAAAVSQRGSSSATEALFWTQILVKRDRKWLITYEHESWPGCDPPTEPHPFTVPGDSAGLLPRGGTR